jgi:hypothetical protein
MLAWVKAEPAEIAEEELLATVRLKEDNSITAPLRLSTPAAEREILAESVFSPPPDTVKLLYDAVFIAGMAWGLDPLNSIVLPVVV